LQLLAGERLIIDNYDAQVHGGDLTFHCAWKNP
jgi:hypothetical protein